MSPRKDNGDTVDIRNRINSFQAQDSLQINKYRTLTISANKEDFKGPISPVSLTRRAKAMARFRDTPTAEN